MIADVSQLQLRQRIQAVRNDPTLNSSEIAKQCQSLFYINLPEISNNPKSNESLTCKHYNKNCSRFQFDCCGIIDPCHRCHYAREICDKKPPQISQIKCNICHTLQPPSQNCTNCNVQFSKSYCEKCKIWTSLEIFHCDECGFCRVGKNGSTFHCQSCDACFSTEGIHVCAKTQLKDSFCPLCLESVHTAQKQSEILPCGHVLHLDCRREAFKKGEYRCPTCRKSLVDMRNVWTNIRQSIQAQPIPARFFPIQEGDVVHSPYGDFKVVSKRPIEITEDQMCEGFLLDWVLSDGTAAKASLLDSCLSKKRRKLIWCYDCETKSTVDFHFLGLECKGCGGFNTSSI